MPKVPIACASMSIKRKRIAGEAGRPGSLASDAERIALFVSESKYGMGLNDLVARTGLLEDAIHKAIPQAPGIILFTTPQFWVIDAGWVSAKIEATQHILKEFHRRNPLLPGLSKEELRSRHLPGAPAFLLDALLARARTIAAEGEAVRLASHKISMKQDEEEAASRIETAFRSAAWVAGKPERARMNTTNAARSKISLMSLCPESLPDKGLHTRVRSSSKRILWDLSP